MTGQESKNVFDTMTKSTILSVAPRLLFARMLPGTRAVVWIAAATMCAMLARAQAPLRINEFVAQNQTGIVDEANQHEDWVELYNDSAAALLVGGMWLSDDPTLAKWQLPAGTAVPAFGTLLVWCDEDPLDGPLHASFKLAAIGESVLLFDSNGTTVLDRIDYGPQTVDVATGRVLDAGSVFVVLPAPTPLQSNRLSACGSRAFAALHQNAHGGELTLGSPPQIGTAPSLDVLAASGTGVAAFLFAFQPAHIDLAPFGFAGEVLLLDSASATLAAIVTVGATGQASNSLNIPNDPSLVSLRLFSQTLLLAGSVVDTSNGLTFVVCP